jgi:DNA repair exonuclease SbcCD ATPase subunit
LQLRATYEALRQTGDGASEQTDGVASTTAQEIQARLDDVRGRIRAMGIEPSMTQLAAERIASGRALGAMEAQAHSSPANIDAQQQAAKDAQDRCALAIRALANALDAATVAVPTVADPAASLDDLRRAHDAQRRAIQQALEQLDMQATQRQRGNLDSRAQQLAATRDELTVRRDGKRQQLVALFAEQGIVATGDESMETLSTQWPAVADDNDPDTLALSMAGAEAREQHLRRQVEDLCRQHGLDAGALDVDSCQRAYDELDRSLRERTLAAEMADEVRQRIVKRVLPETEMHMRALLPELTDGRYRDAKLLDDEETSARLSIRIWDEQAGRWVGKHLFSGGTRDQCSLALRLAFALATLPKELGAMPGFIFLDEPLSSFDDRRSQALVDVLTRGSIGRQFPQVFLISHSQSFDPGAFTCALRMAGGRVATSSLPNEREAHASWQTESSISDPFTA